MGQDSYVQLPQNSTGLKVDTSELQVGLNTVERQRNVLADGTDAAGLAKVSNTTPGATDYGLVVRPVGSVSVSNFPATQPVSAATLPLPTGASTETTLAAIKAKTDNLDVLLSTRTKPLDQQHVIVDSSATVAVTGTFWQATQPVSATSLPLPSGASTETTLSSLNGKVTACNTGAVTVSTLPALTVASAASNSPIGSVSLGNSLGKTNVLKTGTITTTAATADQVVLTYTVTAGKTLYLNCVMVQARLTTLSATASVLGSWSLETPSGTKCMTWDDLNATTSADVPFIIPFPEPIPIAAGVVVRVVCTPAAITSMKWQCSLVGYEK